VKADDVYVNFTPSIITDRLGNLWQAGGICDAPGWRLVRALPKCPTDDAPDFEVVMAWLQEKNAR